jgi:tetratricopeptide (TPR) repeat protein
MMRNLEIGKKDREDLKMLRSQRVAIRRSRPRSAVRGISASAFFVIALWFAAAPTLAQHQGHEPRGSSDAVPEELLERPLPLREGIGKVHEQVTTSSAEAQAYYDQGLAYLHSYVWIEAARSFHQALRLDPRLAMAYVGLSDAYVGLQDVPAAVAAFEKAQLLTEKLSEQERAQISIRGRQIDYLQDSGNLQKYFAYRQAVLDALEKNPNDPWLWILRGFADEGTPTAHGQGGGVDTIAFYEIALKLSPDNFAAHHYLAHTLENHGPVKEALEQSEIYARLAPAIPHAHHMHGHDLRRAGRTEEAIEEFRKADELESAYYRAENIPPELDWHHAHNLQLLALSYEALGQMKAAEAALREAFALPARIDFAEFNRRVWPEFLLDRGRTQEALAASEELANSKWAMARFAGHALAGRAYCSLNQMDNAENELRLAEQETEQIRPAILKLLTDSVLLRAEILLREKKWEEANPLMQKIENDLVAVPGPDAWSEALFQLEYIARVAREAGDWELAESTAQRMIKHDPSYAGGYFALSLAAEHKGDSLAAKQEFAKGEKLWSKADAQLKSNPTQKP